MYEPLCAPGSPCDGDGCVLEPGRRSRLRSSSATLRPGPLDVHFDRYPQEENHGSDGRYVIQSAGKHAIQFRIQSATRAAENRCPAGWAYRLTAVAGLITSFNAVHWTSAQTTLVATEVAAFWALASAITAHLWPQTKKQPVAVAGTVTAFVSATLSLGIGFAWWQLTLSQNASLIGLVTAIVAVFSALVARSTVEAGTTARPPAPKQLPPHHTLHISKCGDTEEAPLPARRDVAAAWTWLPPRHRGRRACAATPA